MDISTEKVVICKLKEAIPKMNDFQKGYMLGMVESMAGKKEKESEQERSWCSDGFRKSKRYPLPSVGNVGRGK